MTTVNNCEIISTYCVVTQIIFCSLYFRQLSQAAASTKSRQWTETQAQVAQSPTTSRYSSAIGTHCLTINVINTIYIYI